MKDIRMTPEWALGLMLFIASVAGGAIWYLISHHQYHLSLWIGFFAGVIVLLVITLHVRNGIINKEIQANTPVFCGQLTPGNEPNPVPLPPGLPSNTISLLLGDDLRVLSAQCKTYIFSKGQTSFLTIGVGPEGFMLITADIMDSTGENIARIINNEFQANPERAFNPKQPDKHSLVVRDSQGVEVLNVRFLNPKVIRIVGRFYLPGYSEPVLILPDDGIRWPGGDGISHLTVDLTNGGGFINFP
jgi:hypothetical protein